MIASLTGRVARIELDALVLEVGGVGYLVYWALLQCAVYEPLSIFIGALTGALLTHRWGALAVFAVAGTALALALAGFLVPPSWRRVWLARKPFRRAPPEPRKPAS